MGQTDLVIRAAGTMLDTTTRATANLRLAKPIFICLLCFSLPMPARPQAKSPPDSAFARGLRNYQAGQWSSAVQEFQQAAKADQSNIYAQFYWGQALFKQQKYEEAVGP